MSLAALKHRRRCQLVRRIAATAVGFLLMYGVFLLILGRIRPEAVLSCVLG